MAILSVKYMRKESRENKVHFERRKFVAIAEEFAKQSEPLQNIFLSSNRKSIHHQTKKVFIIK